MKHWHRRVRSVPASLFVTDKIERTTFPKGDLANPSGPCSRNSQPIEM